MKSTKVVMGDYEIRTVQDDYTIESGSTISLSSETVAVGGGEMSIGTDMVIKNDGSTVKFLKDDGIAYADVVIDCGEY